MITIRQAVYEDIPRIMRFIDEHWKKGHIMGNDRTMFEFQHVRDKEVFYILAEDEDGTIYATMGYIPMSEQKWPCMSTTMIQSLKNPESRMLGEEMARYFEEHMHCYNVFSVGIENRYAKALKVLAEDNIRSMKQYYRLGRRRRFRIAHIDHYEVLPVHDDGISLIPLKTMNDFIGKVDLEQIRKDYPRRSPAYIEHRYYQHPYFTYKIWGLQSADGMKSAFAAREETIDDARVLRIVDFFGRDEDLAYIGKELDRILAEEDYEYVDFYCYGISEEILQRGGFLLRREGDTNIIPNYFDPFEQRNIDLDFYTWYLPKIHVYRGFGDQDRPNHVINHK